MHGALFAQNPFHLNTSKIHTNSSSGWGYHVPVCFVYSSYLYTKTRQTEQWLCILRIGWQVKTELFSHPYDWRGSIQYYDVQFVLLVSIPSITVLILYMTIFHGYMWYCRLVFDQSNHQQLQGYFAMQKLMEWAQLSYLYVLALPIRCNWLLPLNVTQYTFEPVTKRNFARGKLRLHSYLTLIMIYWRFENTRAKRWRESWKENTSPWSFSCHNDF